VISVAEAQATIRRHAAALPAETVSCDQARGRALREPVVSPGDLPPFDRSAMDGYAVPADDPAEQWEVVGEIRAGQTSALQLRAGQAVRIFTGAELPGSGLKVVMQEDVEADGARVRLLRRSGASHVRQRGEDARAGETLLQPGIVLEASALALMASIGKIPVSVSRQPRVLHLTTGDEIVPAEESPGPGQIRNSNAPLIAHLCREWGAGLVTHLHAPDRLETMTALLDQADARSYDLVLISGGSGGGKYDFTAGLFGSLGAEIHFRQVNVRPGKPLIFGGDGAQLVFGLPGNALSHFVCFHLFVRAALDALLARPPEPAASAFVAEAMPDTANSRETWWPVRTDRREGRIEVRALPWKSSGDITRLPGADALIRVPAGTAQLSVGARVDYLSTRACA
jgi:molybdopterin molybdotransferase